MLRYYVETAEHIIAILLHPASFVSLVFSASNGVPR